MYLVLIGTNCFKTTKLQYLKYFYISLWSCLDGWINGGWTIFVHFSTWKVVVSYNRWFRRFWSCSSFLWFSFYNYFQLPTLHAEFQLFQIMFSLASWWAVNVSLNSLIGWMFVFKSFEWHASYNVIQMAEKQMTHEFNQSMRTE